MKAAPHQRVLVLSHRRAGMVPGNPGYWTWGWTEILIDLGDPVLL